MQLGCYRVSNAPALVVAATVICLAPYLNKAFHIDDPLFLWTAEQISKSPFDFYGFPINWDVMFQSMSAINKNPPLVSYYIALSAWLLGWSEIALHSAFLIPAACLSLGVYYIARRWSSHPLIAALASVATPVFLVSSSTVMSDTLMMAFYVWGILVWMKAVDEERTSYYFLASLLVAFSALTKYFGLTAIGLLVVYTFGTRRRLGTWCLFAAIPVLSVVAFEWYTYFLYGQGLFSDALRHSVTTGTVDKGEYLARGLTGLSFAGGCLAPVIFYAPMLWSRREAAIGAGLTIVTLLGLLWMGSLGALPIYEEGVVNLGGLVQCTLFIMGGISVLALASTDLYCNKDVDSLTLLLWVLGPLIFTSYINWTTNARTVFPMVPAVCILLVRRLERSGQLTSSNPPWRAMLPLAPAILLGMIVMWADYSLANIQRTAAGIIHDKYASMQKVLWFEGHWGFQYYMQKLGAKALDFKESHVRDGEVVAIPANNSYPVPLPPERANTTGMLQLMPFQSLSTMQHGIGAGFYSDERGPLPFAFGKVRPEVFLLYTVKRGGVLTEALNVMDRK